LGASAMGSVTYPTATPGTATTVALTPSIPAVPASPGKGKKAQASPGQLAPGMYNLQPQGGRQAAAQGRQTTPRSGKGGGKK